MNLLIQQIDDLKISNNKEYITYEYMDGTIRQRISDGYIMGTDICKIGKKEISHWMELKCTKTFIKYLEKDLNKNSNVDIKVLHIYRGGNKFAQGTWIQVKHTLWHPRI